MSGPLRAWIAARLGSERSTGSSGGGSSQHGRMAALWGRPRTRIWIGALALALCVRAAAPALLRPQLVARADAALRGRIELRDLELALLRGGVALYGLRVYAQEGPEAGAIPEPGALPPVFSTERLWAQISWLSLLTGTLRVEELELENFAVHLEQLDGGLALPEPAPAPEGEPEPEPDAATDADASAPWTILADRVRLSTGQLSFYDHTHSEGLQRFALQIGDLSAQDLLIAGSPDGRAPGQLSLRARIGAGVLDVDARIEMQADGSPHVQTQLALAGVPIRDLRSYVSPYAWSELEGTLDAQLEHRFEGSRAHALSGSLSLSGLAIHVEGRETPALRWRELNLQLEQIDLLRRSAVLGRIALSGAQLPLDARAALPVPLLTPRARPASEPPDTPADVAAGEAPPPPPAWRWSVAEVALGEVSIALAGPEEPLEVDVSARVRDLSSERGTRWPVELALRPGTGELSLEGSLGASPLAFEGRLVVADVPLAPLLQRSGVAAGALLQQGSLRAGLDLALLPRAGAEPAGPSDLRASGSLGLAQLEVQHPDAADAFAATWRDLSIDLRELRVASLLNPESAAPEREVTVELSALRLTEPSLRLTRDAEGLVLPPIAAPSGRSETPESATPEAAPSAAPSPRVSITVDALRVDAARAEIQDRSVEPVFRSSVDRLELRANALRWPDPAADPVAIDLRGLGGARLQIQGSVNAADSELSLELAELPLTQFNPYLAATGYALSTGALSIRSQARIHTDGYELPSDLVLQGLGVESRAEGGLFQQNFGIPLQLALALLTDTEGRIRLSVPVAGDHSGTRVGVLPVVRDALRQALVGALASPLKLLGAVVGEDRIESVAPAPIPFQPGTTQLAGSAATRIEELAQLLRAAPEVALELRGSASAADRRALRERDLLRSLEETSAVEALLALGSRAERAAARAHLEAKRAGRTPPPLDDASARWLETQLAAQSLSEAALEDLARRRVEEVRGRLLERNASAEDRLSLAPPRVSSAPEAGAVELSIGTR